MPVRRGAGKEEKVVHFCNEAEAVADGTNLAEQTITTWKIIQHIQSLTPQRLWPMDVGQGKISAMYLMGNTIFTTGFCRRPAFPQQGYVCDILMKWFKTHVCIQEEGLPELPFECDVTFTEVERNLTDLWSVRYKKAQSVMKMVQRARKALVT